LQCVPGAARHDSDVGLQLPTPIKFCFRSQAPFSRGLFQLPLRGLPHSDVLDALAVVVLKAVLDTT